ncbi:MAG: AzlC family ABC transporter permease [Cyanobacteria bacterium P01_F01_bin.150]
MPDQDIEPSFTPSKAESSRKNFSPLSEFWAGSRDILPLIVGAIPFGTIFGTLAVSKGFSIAATVGLSSIVFAGSSQFIAVGIIAAGAGWLLIVFTAFIVNLRHLLYAVALVPHGQYLRQFSI